MLRSLNILYIEKEEELREHIVDALEFMSMNVTSVSCPDEAYHIYIRELPDIIISDIEMPLKDGTNLLEKIRQNDNDILIIITTTNTQTEYFLKAIELNLVKYLLRPISLNDIKNTLILCIKKIEEKSENSVKYFNKNDYYDLSKRLLFVNNKTIRLDPHERELLELLLCKNNNIVTYSKIDEKIWNSNMSSAAIRSLVRNLRKKLPNHVLENISKIGYKINIINKI